MKPKTHRNIEARYGFKIDEIRPETHKRSWKKFVLKATYPDERRLIVYVWRRTDVHVAIARAIELELTCAAHRLRHLVVSIENGYPLDAPCDSLRAWNTHYLRSGKAVLEAMKGKLARAPHPITCLNPVEWMVPTSSMVNWEGRIYIRNEDSCWFPLDRCQIKDAQGAV